MVDDLKSLKDNLFKVLAGRNQDASDDDKEGEGEEDGDSSFIDSSAARALISTIFARAGKSKDDVVQILAREIGMAVAGMLKQPLSQLAKHQKLQITFEFVPKQKSDTPSASDADESDTPHKKSGAKPRRTRSKSRQKK